MLKREDFEQTLVALEKERDGVWARYWELIGAINATKHWKTVFEAPESPSEVGVDKKE